MRSGRGGITFVSSVRFETMLEYLLMNRLFPRRTFVLASLFFCVQLAGPARAAAQRATASAPSQVLFVCEHGTVKSLLATLLFNEYVAEVGLPMRAISRGSAADSVVPVWMKEKLAANHLTIGSFQPRALGHADLLEAAYVVSFDLPDAVTAGAPAPRARWDSLPPASQDFDGSQRAIKARVHQLVDSLNLARTSRRAPA
jgi:arsenate reductase